MNTDSPLNDRKFHKFLYKVSKLHHKRSHAAMSKFGVSSGQPRMLSHLMDHDGCIQKELSEKWDLEPATVTNILSVMEKSGFIRRETAPEDRRVLKVFLTQKGAEIHHKVEEVFAQVEEECFEGFSQIEKERTLDYLNRIYDNLKKGKGGLADV